MKLLYLFVEKEIGYLIRLYLLHLLFKIKKKDYLFRIYLLHLLVEIKNGLSIQNVLIFII